MTPYTVILMKPDDLRSGDACARDSTLQMHVHAESAEAAFGIAQDDAVIACFGDVQPIDADPDVFEVIAVFKGHLFDLFIP